MKEIDKNSTTIVKNSVQSIKSTSIIDACIMYSEMQSTLHCNSARVTFESVYTYSIYNCV